MKYLFLFLILLSVSIADRQQYQLFWEDPKVTDGCWKIGEDNRITKAPEISKKQCKKLEKAKEYYYLIEISEASIMVMGEPIEIVLK